MTKVHVPFDRQMVNSNSLPLGPAAGVNDLLLNTCFSCRCLQKGLICSGFCYLEAHMLPMPKQILFSDGRADLPSSTRWKLRLLPQVYSLVLTFRVNIMWWLCDANWAISLLQWSCFASQEFLLDKAGVSLVILPLLKASKLALEENLLLYCPF